MKNNLGYHFIANKNDSNFIYEIETKKSMTYGELKKRIKIYQNKKILIKAKKVSIILENSIEYVEFFTLSQIMDFIFHPIPYYTSPVEIKNLLNYFNPDLVITDRKDLTYNKKKYTNLFKFITQMIILMIIMFFLKISIDQPPCIIHQGPQANQKVFFIPIVIFLI